MFEHFLIFKQFSNLNIFYYWTFFFVWTSFMFEHFFFKFVQFLEIAKIWILFRFKFLVKYEFCWKSKLFKFNFSKSNFFSNSQIIQFQICSNSKFTQILKFSKSCSVSKSFLVLKMFRFETVRIFITVHFRKKRKKHPKESHFDLNGPGPSRNTTRAELTSSR
jgi:hypothetical protein